MALVPLASKGPFIHVYDFRVKPGTGEEFIKVKDGVLCRDVNGPDHFYLLGEWKDIDVHREILAELRAMGPAFVGLIDGGRFVPTYAEVVSSTSQQILDRAAR